MRTNSSKMLARCISILGLSLPLMFCAGGAGSTEGADLGVAEEALRPPTKKLTVFAADPELGVFGMYREGTEYVFYRVAVTSSEGKLAPSASFYDREMNPIAESTSTAPAQFVASPRDDAATRAHRGLVVAAAEALDKTLIDQVFVAERSALVGFRRLLGATPRNEGALIGLVAAVTPELRAASSGNYFEGLQRDLKWTAGLGASALEGTYRRSKFHSDLLVFSDERGDMDRPDQPRIERNARLTNAAGDNVVVQLGGHLVPEGYTQGPTEEVGLSKGSIEELETHYQGLGEAFMASRVIDSAANFPAAEKQVFARMGRHLAEQLLPQRADPEQALTSTTNRFCTSRTSRLSCWASTRPHLPTSSSSPAGCGSIAVGHSTAITVSAGAMRV